MGMKRPLENKNYINLEIFRNDIIQRGEKAHKFAYILDHQTCFFLLIIETERSTNKSCEQL